MYGRGHLPSVDKDIMMEKIQKYLPDPLQYNTRYELPVEVDHKGNHIIARSRSQPRSLRSDHASKRSVKSRSTSSPTRSNPRMSQNDARSSKSRERKSRSNSRGRRNPSREQAPINLLITNNQYDGTTFRSGHPSRPLHFSSQQREYKKQITWEDR